MAETSPRQRIVIPTGEIDFVRGRFTSGEGRETQLTERELELLAYLADRPSQSVSRELLRVEVLGQHVRTQSRALDVAIRRLRRKIEARSGPPRSLLTAHGHGYRLVQVTERGGRVPDAGSGRSSRHLRLVDRVVDLSAGVVRLEGQADPLALTAQERLLLDNLADAERTVIDAAVLARRAGMPGRRALSKAIYRLRAKIERDPRSPGYLLTVAGGYRLDAELHRARPSREQLDHALRSLTDHVGGVLGLADCVVYARDGECFVQVAAFGPKRDAAGGVLQPLTQRFQEGIVGHAAALGEPIVVPDVNLDPRYLADLHPARSELAVPVTLGSDVVGVIDSESPRPSAYGPSVVRALSSLAAIAAPAFGRRSHRPRESHVPKHP